MDILDNVAKATVKINCDNGKSGTGFFFNFMIGETNYIPTIITNRHVVEGVNTINLVFSLNDYFSSSEKIIKKHEISYSDVQQQIIYHSNPEIDLCAIKIIPIINFQIEKNIKFEMAHLAMDNIPTDESLEELRYVEDIIMVGYPSGLSDSVNNLPIFRQGATASHPGVDFEGRPECIVDMTVTHGSSGSPVFVYNSNGYSDKRGNASLGSSRLIFLGINRAVYEVSNLGEIIELPSPTVLMSRTNIPINLGVVIKAKTLKDIERQVLEEIGEVKRNEVNN